MDGSTTRASGVTIMAVVAIIAGILHVVAGVADIAIGGGFLSDIGFGATLDSIMTVVGIALVGVGALALTAGYGLWQQRPWAWTLTRLWASLCVVVGIVGAALSLFADAIVGQILATALASVAPAILAAVVLWYLYRPEIKTAFGRA